VLFSFITRFESSYKKFEHTIFKAVQHNINNYPDINSLDCMLELIVHCLQSLRDKLGKPMVITSGYRNSQVNKLVNGAANSQHTKGQAVDFTVKGMTVAQVVEFVKKSGVEYDQLINEYGSWVHISYNKGKNRKQVLKY